MKFIIDREALLKPLQMVAGAVERKQTMPILGNVLVDVNSHQLHITATDTEVELNARVTLGEPAEAGQITAPARKLIDICRSLPESASLTLTLKGEKLLVQSGRSRFSLATLPAEDFPNVDDTVAECEFTINSTLLARLIETTYFAMAQQDVRYYLNGLLLELRGSQITTVATDGHRLAFCHMAGAQDYGEQQVILPRKGVAELIRLLNQTDEDLSVSLTVNHLKIAAKGFTFTSKLIEGRFPDYQRVIPRQCPTQIEIDRDVLKDALTRASILSNEKYRGVRLELQDNLLKISANNPEQEEAEEELLINYSGKSVEVGFNVGYLVDVMNAMPEGGVNLGFTDTFNAVLIESKAEHPAGYVVMPMRL